jgi:hypothetical protein
MQTEIHMTLNEYANRALRLDRHALHRNILIIIIMVGWYMKPTNKKNKKKEEFERRKKKCLIIWKITWIIAVYI